MTGVIFDFNGTLFYDTPKHLEAWNQMSIELRGKSLTEEELNKHIKGVPNHVTIAYFLGNDTVDFTSYSLHKEEIYRQLCRNDKDTFHLVAGAEEMFDTLKEKEVPMTIASASIIENVRFFIESFHLDSWFNPEKIVYDDGSYINKVAMFIDAAKKIGVNIEDCIIFEDSLSGIQSAYKAGCRKIISVNVEQINSYLGYPGVVKEIKDFKEFDFKELI